VLWHFYAATFEQGLKVVGQIEKKNCTLIVFGWSPMQIKNYIYFARYLPFEQNVFFQPSSIDQSGISFLWAFSVFPVV
jgi:hypothetical protein